MATLPKHPDAPALIGSSASMAAVRAAVARAARTALPVLIEGPVGSGKSHAAFAIHAASVPANRLMHVIAAEGAPGAGWPLCSAELSCGCGAETHEHRREPLTIMIDGVDSFGPDAQTRLATAIDRTASGPAPAARWIAIARGPARDAVREDLRYRLSGIEIALPALRERIEDLPELVAHFAQLAGAGRPAVRFSVRAMARLATLSFPGNVRELRYLVERAAANASGGETISEAALRALIGTDDCEADPWWADDGLDLDDVLAQTERSLIRRALACSGGSVAHAARLLNLRRTTLIDRVRKHGLRADADGSEGC